MTWEREGMWAEARPDGGAEVGGGLEHGLEEAETGARLIVTAAKPGEEDELMRRLETGRLAERRTVGGELVVSRRGMDCLADALERRTAEAAAPAGSTSDCPCYNPHTRELRWRGEVVKRLWREARNQEALLRASEDCGWRSPIANPLELEAWEGPSEVLRQTIKDLNKGLKPGTIRFHMDGKGTGFCWEALS